MPKNVNTDFILFTISDWVNLLTKKLHLDIYQADLLLYDLRLALYNINNSRCRFWVEALEEERVSEDIIDAFKKFTKLEEN